MNSPVDLTEAAQHVSEIIDRTLLVSVSDAAQNYRNITLKNGSSHEKIDAINGIGRARMNLFKSAQGLLTTSNGEKRQIITGYGGSTKDMEAAIPILLKTIADNIEDGEPLPNENQATTKRPAPTKGMAPAL